MIRGARAALAVVPAAFLLAGCGSGPSSGTVTAWTWMPPTVQTVDMSCAIWSGSKTSSICLDYNTAQMPDPQVCKLTFTSDGKSGTASLNVGEAQCRAFLGQHWPPGGTASASK